MAKMTSRCVMLWVEPGVAIVLRLCGKQEIPTQIELGRKRK